MRGYLMPPDDDAPLEPWAARFVATVGNVIDFWGFKRNQGRLWAVLYLRARPMSAAELQASLDLSKGAVSMLTRELEQWGIIHRVRQPAAVAWHFVAETDLQQMLMRVLRERESHMIARVKEDLRLAEREASRQPDVSHEISERLLRVRLLATLAERSLHHFLETSHLDASAFAGILDDTPLPDDDP